MKIDLKITALSHNILWKNPAENFLEIEQHLKPHAADLFLLPEMFTTGFSMEPMEIADEQNTALAWMQRFAREKDAAVAGTVSVKEGDCFFNRLYFVFPDGRHQQYDKRHLFTYSGENEVYTPGQERVVVSWKGVRILLQICYDLRFPVFSRNRQDYDLALYLANWPSKRIEAWDTLLKARAIENVCYVFGVNRMGTDGNGLHYPFSTECFFADGQPVSTRDALISSAEISLEELEKFRQHFSFLNDADDFELK